MKKVKTNYENNAKINANLKRKLSTVKAPRRLISGAKFKIKRIFPSENRWVCRQVKKCQNTRHDKTNWQHLTR